MALTIGTQLGSHEITALLGKGGMGEVYRARDLKLKREVAIKILPEGFSRDTDRLSRFQREAEVLASGAIVKVILPLLETPLAVFHVVVLFQREIQIIADGDEEQADVGDVVSLLGTRSVFHEIGEIYSYFERFSI